MDICLIIPAYNEEERIGAVLEVAIESGLFKEIVVVDDGSSDNTCETVRATGVKTIRHNTNKGKAQAMLTGLDNTRAGIVTFLDADLLHITTEHINSLVTPVATGDIQAGLAVFTGGRIATTLAQKITPMISGQRCLQRSLFDGFDAWDSRFGIETAINDHLRSLSVEQKIVSWKGAAQVMKEEKRGCLAGGIARLGMYRDIITAWVKTKQS